MGIYLKVIYKKNMSKIEKCLITFIFAFIRMTGKIFAFITIDFPVRLVRCYMLLRTDCGPIENMVWNIYYITTLYKYQVTCDLLECSISKIFIFFLGEQGLYLHTFRNRILATLYSFLLHLVNVKWWLDEVCITFLIVSELCLDFLIQADSFMQTIRISRIKFIVRP